MSDTDALTAATAALTERLGTDGEFLPCSMEDVARTVLDAAGFGAAAEQPMPIPTDAPDGVHDRAIAWMTAAAHYRIARDRGDLAWVVSGLVGRKVFGLRKYGTTLQPTNGRDAGGDCVAEVFDAIAYAQTGYEQALAANDEIDRRFWWQRRSRLTDEAIELGKRATERSRVAGERQRVDDVAPGSEWADAATGEGDEGALAVTRDRSTP